MFNGYNETPLISYEFNQERVEKKHENVPKWSYGHDVGVQPGQAQPSNRHLEFWPGKSNFLGIPNVVKCSCTGCYPSTEKQSYQGDTRHRPWLPRTFPVPVNGSNEPSKLPGYQWDNGLSNQGSCYPDTTNLPYVQENGRKYPYYNHSRLAEPNQPGVITSIKNTEKPKNEMSSRGQESPVLNGARHQPPVFCNPGFSLTPKRADGRNYCDAIEKYSNVASYSLDQHVARLPVVEPFTKAVPSNLSQSHVPSTGYRSVKENMPQSYMDLGYGDGRKICTEPPSEKTFSTGPLQPGIHGEYSHFNRDCPEPEGQKLFFDNARHPDYYSRSNFPDVVKRNNPTLESRKDCIMNQINEMNEQHYNIPRLKYQEVGNSKPCDGFYPKEFEKSRPETHLPDNSGCFQRNDDRTKNENVRSSPSALLLNDPRFADRAQNSFTYQSSPVSYRNYLGREYQGYNAQARYEYPTGNQRNDLTHYRGQQLQLQQGSEQLPLQQGNGFPFDSQSLNSEKSQQLCGGKNPPFVQTDPLISENRNPTYLESIRGEKLNKNGATKISPLRLLRKKKFINVPQDKAPVSSLNAVPGLDVRKFWSTWAEEEEENVAPTQVVVLDCQNIDPEQAKLLHLYEADPVRAIHLEANGPGVKNADVDQGVRLEETCENSVNEPKTEEQRNVTEVFELQQDEKAEGNSSADPETKSETPDSISPKTVSVKHLNKGKFGKENREKKKSEAMDKWTEKKFDFLKRAEESKAAEILRHEEEKKKIFERRLSLQQSLKKIEKLEEKNEKKGEEKMSSFDENSQSDSPDPGNAEVSHLPTSEFRRNKFLDYSAGKVTTSGEQQTEKSEEDNESVHAEVEEVEKEEKINLQLFEDSKLKEETGGEMDDILKRMSEMNFQCPDIKLEKNFEESKSKKGKSGKKPKRKNSLHQTENDERSDKLTVETATKPTIKFSIQKSHDLKISFKVLNSSKEYSDEDLRSEGADYKGKANEDSKNSTELITLKYKSIQRDGDGRQISDLKKSRRRKKQSSKTKSPVLKIKKSRYALEEEKDPLAVDEDPLNVSRKYYSDTRDGFQVQETMDSAKIKLTFKRHKGNFETEYKINSNLEKIAEVDPMREEKEERMEIDERGRKKSKRVRRSEIFAEADCPEQSDVESSSEVQKPGFESLLEEDSRNSTTSQSFSAEQINSNFHLETSTFPEFPSITQNQNGPCEEMEKKGKETRVVDQELQEFGLINSEVDSLSEDKLEEFPLSRDEEFPSGDLTESKPVDLLEEDEERKNSEEEIQEISFDLINNSTKLVEVNQNSGNADVECSAVCVRDKNEEDPKRSSYKFKSERGEDEEISFKLENSTATEEGLKDESPNSSPLLPLSLRSEKCLETPEATDKEETTSGLPIFLSTTSHEETADNLKETSSEPGDLKSLIENLITDDSKCEFTPLEGNSSTPKTPQDISLPSFVSSDEKPSESATEKPKNEIEFEKKAVDSKPEESHRTDFEILLEKAEDRPKNDFEDPSEVFENSDNMEVCSFLENVESLREDLDKSGNLAKEYEKVDFVSEEDSRIVERTVEDVWAPVVSSSTSCERESPERRPKDFASADTERTESIYIAEVEKEDVKIESQVLSPRAEPSTLNHLGDDSGCAECSFSADEAPPFENLHETFVKTQNGEYSPLCSDVELEDGEIVDSCDESEENSREKNEETQSRENVPSCKRKIEFFVRKIERRHSVIRGNSVERRESENVKTKKFSKAGSCPPKYNFPKGQEKQETLTYIPVEDIPLPLGPPQEENCFDFKKCMNLNITQTKVSETPKESESPELSEISHSAPSRSPSEPCQIETCSTSRPEGETAPPSGILQRNSKIKFSFIKRSKHSKICLKPESPSQSESNVRKIEEFRKEENNLADCLEEKQDPNAKGRQETPVVGEELKIENDFEDTKNAVELTCEDLESVEAMDSMSDFIRDEFYECEDIPTSEDLTNGEDLDSEKVNDDKFRNIMQNCLDNAKKFLNVGNLKLFSCSVDDLLELDCQESSVESTGKTVANISRDVLLGSCEDTNDDLGLCENVHSSDISMDFAPSFCTDACPEIFPVDNWPYLEEEVPSSPTISKSDETDVIATLDEAQTDKSPIEGSRGSSEATFKRFRRKSFLSDVGSVKMCSKIQRRNTIDRFTGMPCRKDIRDLKKDLMKWKKEVEGESKSLKCRLSLDKITSNRRIHFAKKSGGGMEKAKSLDYRSPTWQPKVMLFRISKNELRKVLESSKVKRRLSDDSLSKRQVSSESKNEVIYAFKKPENLEPDYEVEPEPLEKENLKEKSIDLLKLDSIKGSFSSGAPDLKKRKKSRFRNLHSKRKPEPETVIKCNSSPAESAHVDAETSVPGTFKDCDPKIKNTKVCNKSDDEKRRRKSGEIKPADCESRLNGNFKAEREERSAAECKKEKSERRHEHRRREKSEGRDHRKHKDRGSEGGKEGRCGSSHDRGKHEGKKSPKRFKRESEEKKWKSQGESSPGDPWVCEVCGFNDAGERVLHIKSHPFHCQSCHLAFKTEAHFISHLTKKHKDIRNQHHCLLCELSFDTEDQYQGHLETREHRHLESVEKNTINTLFTLLTGAPCPVFGLVEMKPEWLPNQAGTVHFYHQATPLSLALQYLKMHHDLMAFSKPSSPQPN